SLHPERTMQTASSAGKRRWFHFMVCVSFFSRSKSAADAGSAVERGTDRPVVSDSVLGRGVHLTSEDRSVPLIGSGPSGGWRCAARRHEVRPGEVVDSPPPGLVNGLQVSAFRHLL